MIQTTDDFYTGAEPYVALFNAFAEKHSLVRDAQADHICYKCDSKHSFEEIRSILEKETNFIYQSIISNRRIAIVRLKKGIETVLGIIYFVELSDQKPDNTQKEGFDHIEVFPTGISYDEMVRKLEQSEKVIKEERPHHTTHDIDIGGGFKFRCEAEPLVEKIKREEMV